MLNVYDAVVLRSVSPLLQLEVFEDWYYLVPFRNRSGVKSQNNISVNTGACVRQFTS